MGDDFKNQFRAAKAARTTVKPNKDQLKALKAQKAAAAAAQQQETSLAAGRDEDTKSMPPPPPRPSSLPPPSSSLQKPPAAAGPGSYHQDSQGTRINDGGAITAASLLHSEPSVNKQAAPQHNNNNNLSLVESNALLPTGFIEAAIAAQGSTGGGLSLERVVSKGAKSGEGSTGAAFGGGDKGEVRSVASVGDFLAATSQLSAMAETELNQVAPAVSHALQDETSQKKKNTKKNRNIVLEGDGTSSRQQQLPTGFFDAASTAPQGTKASAATGGTRTKDINMDKQFADFMKQVDVDVDATQTETEAEAAGAVEDDEDDENAKRARDDFEQFVRMERLRELKEASKTAATNGTTQFETALEEKPASVLDIAGVVADDVVPPPKLVLPRKRKVTETVAIVDKEELSDDSSEDEEGGGGAGMVDWRAKKSVKK